MVDEPLRLPNCLISMICPMSSSIQETTKSSNTLAKMGVNDMGRVSPPPCGFEDLGTGVMFESFHIDGTVPVERDRLKISVTGKASS